MLISREILSLIYDNSILYAVKARIALCSIFDVKIYIFPSILYDIATQLNCDDLYAIQTDCDVPQGKKEQR